MGSTTRTTPSTKFLLRLREDAETVALKLPMDDREVLQHRGYPAVLFRLSVIRRDQLADLLELAGRFAPRRLVAAFDARPAKAT